MGYISMPGYRSLWVPWDVERLEKERVEGTHGSGTGQDNFSHPPSSCPLADSKYLRQEAEISVQNATVGVMEEFQDAVHQEMKCIGCSQLRKEFLLLSLVVQDFCFRIAEGNKSGRFRRGFYAPYSSSHIPNSRKL